MPPQTRRVRVHIWTGTCPTPNVGRSNITHITNIVAVAAWPGWTSDRGSPGSARAAVEGHRRLLTVLRRGDAGAARDEMHRHLIAVRGHLQIG
jgi:DNA-binding FadR family transcriptional regulator